MFAKNKTKILIVRKSLLQCAHYTTKWYYGVTMETSQYFFTICVVYIYSFFFDQLTWQVLFLFPCKKQVRSDSLFLDWALDRTHEQTFFALSHQWNRNINSRFVVCEMCCRCSFNDITEGTRRDDLFILLSLKRIVSDFEDANSSW